MVVEENSGNCLYIIFGEKYISSLSLSRCERCLRIIDSAGAKVRKIRYGVFLKLDNEFVLVMQCLVYVTGRCGWSTINEIHFGALVFNILNLGPDLFSSKINLFLGDSFLFRCLHVSSFILMLLVLELSWGYITL